jgi:hypothetical protein
MIEDSFAKTGIYPLNIDRFFNNCTSKIDKDEYEQLLLQVDPLTEVFEQQGELYDGDYEAVGIRPGPKKDNRCISGKRSAILTDPNFYDREATIRAWKRAKANEAEVRRLARLANAENLETENVSNTGLMLRIPRVEVVINDE